MKNDVKMSSLHPLSIFSFFLVAVILSIFFSNPAFLAISFICSFLLYLSICKFKALKLLASSLILAVVLCVVSPFFNPLGSTVLFTYFAGRPYTLEAMFYGLSVAIAFISVIFWFASYSKIMTMEKFNALFGNVAPKFCILVSMADQMSRRFIRRWKEISSARRVNGYFFGHVNTRMQKIAESSLELEGLTIWALESSVNTADSMSARGFELRNKTSYSPFRFKGADLLFMAMTVCLGAMTIALSFTGVTFSSYIPDFVSSADTSMMAICAISFALLLFMPTFVNLWGYLSWRFYPSKI